MAIADLFWACPLCGTVGAVRSVRRRFGRRRDACVTCGAGFSRGDGAAIVAVLDGVRVERRPAEWESLLGRVQVPVPADGGPILGPDRVRVRRASGQRPLRYGTELIGWVEQYVEPEVGTLELLSGAIIFVSDRGKPEKWSIESVTGIQPASSTIQLAFGADMVSIRFVDGPLRLWTRALADQVVSHYTARGCDVLEFQPRIRVCAARQGTSSAARGESGL